MSIPDAAVESVVLDLRAVLLRSIQASRATQGDFAQLEHVLRRTILAARRLLVDCLLSASAESAGGFACPACGEALRVHGRRPRTIVTSCGEGTYESVRYRCLSCEMDHYPVEVANGLDGGSTYTPDAKGLVAELASDMPFGRAASWASRMGVPVSGKEVDRLVQEVASWRKEEELEARRIADGNVMQGREEVAPSLHDWSGWSPTDVAVISVDGAMVRSTSHDAEGRLEWFECRTGIVAPADEKSKGATHYVAGVKSVDDLFAQLRAVLQSDPRKGRRRQFIADGAECFWPRAAVYFPTARQSLDIYHAGGHIGQAATACWGSGSPVTDRWKREARRMLLEPEGPEKVREELWRELATGNAHNLDDLEREVKYLDEHKDRMPYAELHAKGLPVGSGAMESAVKQTTAARMRMPGMKWTRRGADDMLCLRATCLSGALNAMIVRWQGQLQAAAMPYRRLAPAPA